MSNATKYIAVLAVVLVMAAGLLAAGCDGGKNKDAAEKASGDMASDRVETNSESPGETPESEASGADTVSFVLVSDDSEGDENAAVSGEGAGLFAKSEIDFLKASSWVVEAAGKLRRDPAEVRTLADDILKNGNPSSCKYEILALGLAGTDASRSALLDILVSDAHPQLKMWAAVGAAATYPPGDGSIQFRFDSITFQVNVEAIKDEALLRAVCMELRLTRDEFAEGILLQVFKRSAANAFVAEQLWRWAVSAEYGVQVPERANKIVAVLQKNPAIYARSRKLLEDVEVSENERVVAAVVVLGGLGASVTDDSDPLVPLAKQLAGDAIWDWVLDGGSADRALQHPRALKASEQVQARMLDALLDPTVSGSVREVAGKALSNPYLPTAPNVGARMLGVFGQPYVDVQTKEDVFFAMDQSVIDLFGDDALTGLLGDRDFSKNFRMEVLGELRHRSRMERNERILAEHS
jgi:hypothetical protein